MLNDIPPARPITYPGNTDGIAVDSLFNLRLPADILRLIISNSVYSISTLTKLTSRELMLLPWMDMAAYQLISEALLTYAKEYGQESTQQAA
jgi:hypothetical protein